MADQMDAAAEWVRSASVDEAIDVAERARLAQAYVKAVGAARRLAESACRLECEALRRIGQLGSFDALRRTKNGAQRVGIAKSLAAMTDDAFAQLLATIPASATAVGVMRAWKRDQDEAEADRTGRGIGSGRAKVPLDAAWSLRALVQAATCLLDNYASDLGAIDAMSVAEELAQDIGSDWQEAAVRAGYKEAVRLAIQSYDSGGSWMHPDLPEWVSYEEDEAGWVRVPARAASLEQFRAMVAFRRHQADTLTAQAETYERALAELDATAACFPDCPRKLYELSERSGAMVGAA